jgi:hypothetical protein
MQNTACGTLESKHDFLEAFLASCFYKYGLFVPGSRQPASIRPLDMCHWPQGYLTLTCFELNNVSRHEVLASSEGVSAQLLDAFSFDVRDASKVQHEAATAPGYKSAVNSTAACCLSCEHHCGRIRKSLSPLPSPYTMKLMVNDYLSLVSWHA